MGNGFEGVEAFLVIGAIVDAALPACIGGGYCLFGNTHGCKAKCELVVRPFSFQPTPGTVPSGMGKARGVDHQLSVINIVPMGR